MIHAATMAAAVVGLGAALPAARVPDAELAGFVDGRAAEWRLTAADKSFDRIGWAPDIRAARRLALEHNRPVFLFTMDGRVNTGRC